MGILLRRLLITGFTHDLGVVSIWSGFLGWVWSSGDTYLLRLIPRVQRRDILNIWGQKDGSWV
jgi:hypothetical protein